MSYIILKVTDEVFPFITEVSKLNLVVDFLNPVVKCTKHLENLSSDWCFH